MSWRAVLIAGVLLAGGCGGSSSSVVGAGDGGDGHVGAGLRCGIVSFPSTTVDLTALQPFTEDVAGYVGDQVGADPYFVARFERDGEWRAVAWGACFLETQLDGYGVAQLELDPTNELDPASTSLSLLATERACAGGRAPGDRAVRPAAVESGRSVQIAVFVQTPPGDQTCPGNPSFPLEIELAGPLGDRIVYDTALTPPTELRPSAAMTSTASAPNANSIVEGFDPQTSQTVSVLSNSLAAAGYDVRGQAEPGTAAVTAIIDDIEVIVSVYHRGTWSDQASVIKGGASGLFVEADCADLVLTAQTLSSSEVPVGLLDDLLHDMIDEPICRGE